MTQRTCSIENCANKYYSRGWCQTHYGRWRRTGDPEKLLHFSNPEQAFITRTEWIGNCLIWTGSRTTAGYGNFSVHGRSEFVHRYAWERVNGPIPPGMVIDHKDHCNPACCNVQHLRLATRPENNYNQDGAHDNNKSSGVRNVYRSKNKWRVQLGKGGKTYWFGQYSTIQEAALVAEQARKDLFGDYAGRG